MKAIVLIKLREQRSIMKLHEPAILGELGMELFRDTREYYKFLDRMELLLVTRIKTSLISNWLIANKRDIFVCNIRIILKILMFNRRKSVAYFCQGP